MAMIFKLPSSPAHHNCQITVTSLYQLAGREIPRLVKLAKSDPSSKPGFIVTSSLLPRSRSPVSSRSLSPRARSGTSSTRSTRSSLRRACTSAS